jgi:hypothetical protein
VAVLSGADFATVTHLPDVRGSHVQGWQTAVRDIQAFRGQTIKLQFQAERWSGRGAQAYVDALAFYADVPGWSISDAAAVNARNVPPLSEGALTIPNADFNQTAIMRDVQIPEADRSFSTQPLPLDPATYPANADFNTGTLDGWSVSDTEQVGVQSDGAGPDGDCLWLQAPYQWAQSSSFTVPPDAQSIHFSYMAWTGRNATEDVALHVAVLSGADFATVTNLPDVRGSHVQGWQAAVRDIQAFRGQTIKLQFQAERWNGRGAQAYVDALTLFTDVPYWILSDADQVAISTQAPPSPTSVFQPENADFSAGPREVSTAPALQNGTFATGTLDGWDVSDPADVAVQNDDASQDGAYLWLQVPYAWAQSNSFVVPDDAQSVHFNYMAWAGRNATEEAALHVAVLSGSDFSVRTNLPDVRGSHVQGWQAAVRDIQAFRGQTIKLQFQAERWSGRSAQARVDSIAFYNDIPDWIPSDAGQVNPYQEGADAGYVWLQAPYQSVRSSSFTVPTNAQNLEFDYMAWTPRNDQEQVALHIDILSGVNFGVQTSLPNVTGAQTDGWQTATLDISSFRGRTIQVQFQAERWGGRTGQARLDNIRFVGNAQSPPTLNETNPGGEHIWLKHPYAWIRTRPFVVPRHTQSVHFDYVAWTPRNANEDVALHVSALSGSDLNVRTKLRDVRGAQNQGWQVAVIDLQAFAGQVIQLEFQAERWNGRGGQARVDAITFHTDVPDWTPSHAHLVNIISDPEDATQGTLLLDAPYAAATSAPIEIPVDVTELHFDYAAWTPRNPDEAVPLHVDVLSGPNFATVTRLGSPTAAQNQGMLTVSLDISAFRHRVVQLRFQAEAWNGRDSRAQVDNITFAGDTTLPPLGGDMPYGNPLTIAGPDQWAASNTLVLTSTGRLRFDYLAWTPRNATEQVKVYVEALSGPAFETITPLQTFQSSAVAGWQMHTLVDLAAFYDQTIMLRFRTDGSNGWQAHMHIANVVFEPVLYTATETGATESFPPSTSACTAYTLDLLAPTQVTTPAQPYFVHVLFNVGASTTIDFDPDVTTDGPVYKLYSMGDTLGGDIAQDFQLPQGTTAQFKIAGLLSPVVVEFCVLTDWDDLISFRASEDIQRGLLCRSVILYAEPDALETYTERVDSAHVHKLEEAWGSINIDYYEVRFSNLPEGFSGAEDLLEHIRLNFNDFINRDYSEFFPYSQVYPGARGGDDANWNGPSPLDAILSITIPGERGSVVTTAHVLGEEHAYWRFSTIWIGGDTDHPVSGNREFGVKQIDTETWAFYTRGADRTTTLLHYAGSRLVWSGADELWKSLQIEVDAFLREELDVGPQSDDVSITPRDSYRYPWRTVQGTYWNPQTDWIPAGERCQQ